MMHHHLVLAVTPKSSLNSTKHYPTLPNSALYRKEAGPMLHPTMDWLQVLEIEYDAASKPKYR